MPRGQSTSGFTDGTITIGTNVDTAGINSGLAKISKSFKRFGALTAGTLGIASVIRLGRQAIKAASDLQEVQNIVDVTFGDLEWKMEKFAKTAIEAYGMSEFTAKQTAGSFMAMGKASGIAAEDSANMALQLTALAGDMASFYNISQDYAKVALSAVYTGETETLKRYGIILTEANLQEFAATQGIEEKVKAMGSADKAMLRYQYILQATQDIQGDFIRTQDNWANQVRVLEERWKQFLISLGSGLITVFNPVVKTLNNILQVLTAWVNAVGKMLAKLLGLKWQDFEEETAQLSDATADLADSEDALGTSAEKAGKKLKKSLMPFDELNVLTKQAAGNADGLADNLGFVVKDFETAFDVKDGGFDFQIPDFSTWYEFGKYLSDTFAGLLNKIPWDDIQEKARKLATNIADFVNGLFQPETFAVIGTTIAEALNTAFTFAFTLGQGIDFENIGKSISAGINNFFLNFDFTQAAAALNTWAHGLWTAISTALMGDEGIDWALIRQKLAEFLSELDIETVAVIIGLLNIKKILKVSLVKTALKALTPVAKEIALALGTAIAEQFAKIKLSLLAPETAKLMFGANFFTSIAEAWASLGGLSGIGTLDFATLFGAGTGTEIGLALGAEILGGIVAFFGGTMIGTGLGKTISYALGMDDGAYDKYLGLKGVIPLIKDLGIAIKDFFNPEIFKQTSVYSFFSSIGDSIKNAWASITTWLGDAGYAISHMFTDAVEAITNIWSTVVSWFSANIIQPLTAAFTAFGAWWSNLFSWFGSIFESAWLIIKASWMVATQWFNDNVIQPVVNLFSMLGQAVINIFNRLWSGIQAIWNTAVSWVSGIVNAVLATINVFWMAVSNGFAQLWAGIQSVWGTVTTWVQANIITPIQASLAVFWTAVTNGFALLWTNIQTMWMTATEWFQTSVIDPIKNAFDTLWNGITDGIKNALNAAIGTVENFINFVIDAINGFTSGLSKIASAAAAITGDSYSGIGQISHVTLPRLAEGAVIPPNREFMAILGDQKHGTNIEAPLDTILQAFRTALNENDNNAVMNMMAQQVRLLEIIANKQFGITEEELFNSVRQSASNFTLETGERAF